MGAPHPIDPAAIGPLLRLNNEHAEELSPLDASTFRRLVAQPFLSRAIGCDAFLLAFDQDARYESPNYLWFRERVPRFVYVDRVVVAPEVRGLGHARARYADLVETARAAGHDRIVCEVNSRPANPASDAFHARLGFAERGRAEIHGGAKAVRYLELGLRGLEIARGAP